MVNKIHEDVWSELPSFGKDLQKLFEQTSDSSRRLGELLDNDGLNLEYDLRSLLGVVDNKMDWLGETEIAYVWPLLAILLLFSVGWCDDIKDSKVKEKYNQFHTYTDLAWNTHESRYSELLKDYGLDWVDCNLDIWIDSRIRNYITQWKDPTLMECHPKPWAKKMEIIDWSWDNN